MSHHYKFEVHIATPGETNDEQDTVEHFAWIVKSVAGIMERDDLKITVHDIERT